jgi:DNA-binding CsgD family transcriptional regulator
VGIAATVAELVCTPGTHLKRLIALELAFLFTMASTFMTELNRGGPTVFDEATRIGGLMGVSLLVVTIPRYVHARPPLVLLANADRAFTAAGLALLAHYVVSSAYHFGTRAGTPYFSGYRVLPAFLAFFALAAAHTYLAIAFVTARPAGDFRRAEKRILSGFGLVSFAVVPLMLVLDNLRWMFPWLWALHPVERFVVLPLFYAYLNLTIILAIRSERRGIGMDLLGSRYGFSSRQSDVAALILEGCTYLQIADRLYISLSTVQSHVASLYRKAGVQSKIQLANLLLEQTRKDGRAALRQPRREASERDQNQMNMR